MDPCLVAELIHVLFPMHICYTKPNPLCLLWDCVRVQPGCCWFCVRVCSVVLAPVCSQCLWGGFLLLQLLQGFCWASELSSFFPSWPLEESTFMDLLNWWDCSKPQSQPVTHGLVRRGSIGNEERQENIYVELFSLILWSWLNRSKRVTLFQAVIIDEAAITDGVCSGIEMGPKMMKSLADSRDCPNSGNFSDVLSVSWTVSLMAMNLGRNRRNKDFSPQGLGVTDQCLKVTQRILGRGISKSRFDIKKCDQIHWQSSLCYLLNG